MLERIRGRRQNALPRQTPSQAGAPEGAHRVTIVHYADPFCWWSWGLEPVLSHLKEVYGDALTVEYRMGGVFTDIAAWRKEYGVDETTTIDWTRESADRTKNPVDVDYMRKTGVLSTHPSCRAFKAAQLQDPVKAVEFFRRMMIAFQVECQHPTDEVIARLAAEVHLDPVRLLRDAASEAVRIAFEGDRAEMERALASFLTLVVVGGGEQEAVKGVFSSGPIEAIIDRLVPGLSKRTPTDLPRYLTAHPGLTTAHEIGEVFGWNDHHAETELDRLVAAGSAFRSEFSRTPYWSGSR